MKNFRFFEIILTVFLSSSGYCKEVIPEESWFSCTTDSDCIEIKYTCAGGVVNKKYTNIAKDYYQIENARTNCLEGEPTENQKKTPYKVFCELKKCKVQGVYPKKPGFS